MDIRSSAVRVYRHVAPLEQGGTLDTLPWDRTCLEKWVTPLESTDMLLRWSKDGHYILCREVYRHVAPLEQRWALYPLP